jgi:hypothetical protein
LPIRDPATAVKPNTSQPEINATLDFSTVGDLTTASANGTIAFPKSEYWTPFDTSTAHFGAVYDQDSLPLV